MNPWYMIADYIRTVMLNDVLEEIREGSTAMTDLAVDISELYCYAMDRAEEEEEPEPPKEGEIIQFPQRKETQEP